MTAAPRTTALERFLADEAATSRLGEDLAMALRPGDVVALSGDLGTGKTTLARGLVRALAGDPSLDVPSPTFTLVQSYQARVPVHHFDLYRLSAVSELDELGLDEALADGAVLIEWPERAGARLPPGAIRLELCHRSQGRLARIDGSGSAFDRLARSLAMRDFLSAYGWGDAGRRHFAGDASARSYEMVSRPGAQPRLLMNSPRLAPGQPVRGDRSYADIAHTARSAAAFVAVDRALAAGGVTVPAIYAQDLDQGFLLIEHLGDESVLGPAGTPQAYRYEAAANLLAAVHARSWPRRMVAAPGVHHDVPPFDRDAMLIEAELLIDWYFPFVSGKTAGAALRQEFRNEWHAALDRLAGGEESLVLRDFHSPNIIWRPGRRGHDRLGILDFQDALIGPPAYDVASLAMDARATIPPEIEEATVEAYVAARETAGPFDRTSFQEAYAVMAAQRNSKILGIFVRLDRRDGKPDYLGHLPRIRNYLDRAFEHPALAGLAGLYRRSGLLAGEAGR
jgi:tRNA threonylcarbamoyl adenosine modification protein YjeE